MKAATEAEPAFAGARLTWIPFTRESQSLRDPSTGLALQEGLLRLENPRNPDGSRAPRSCAAR